ncbi:MAG TPA: hypothetical protein VFQ36_18780 [Ktedonobacteraceae bacterium]|nr:hypothetical protein [Ktedonobacteraceae bacterium]
MLSEDIFEDDLPYEAMRAIEFYEAFHKGYEEGFHLGELQGLRAVIADTIEDRFPSLVTLVSSHIQKIEDIALLRRLNVKLSAAQTVQEAEQVFKTIVKDAQQH